MPKVSVHTAGLHFLFWEAATPQGSQGERVLTINQAEWAKNLSCTVGTMTRKIKRMEMLGRIRCLTVGTRGGTPYAFEINDPAGFDVEQEA